jgi:glucose-1-phosphate thymidylyltransferase
MMDHELVGLIPAAGLAKRVSPLPGSKELFPIGFQEVKENGNVHLRPKVVSQYLLENMFRAGVRKVWFVLGRGKWDIMHYYGDGSNHGGNIAYLLMDKLWGMPFTLDRAWSWLNRDTILFGMPDTIFTPPDAFVKLLAQHKKTKSHVTLGIFPTQTPHKLCPVKLDADGYVLDMEDKPTQTELMNTWGCACWSPEFSDFMHGYLESRTPPTSEVVLASVFRAALDGGLRLRGVYFDEGEYIDIGTPNDLADAVRRFSYEVA